MRTLHEAPIFRGTRVFVRCDLDVLIKDGKILEPYRLEASLPTLKYIIKQGGFPVIAGHMGKPNGKFTPEISTKNLEPFFTEHLGAKNFQLLENLRFDPREELNDETYARELASHADIYVNESFATNHRAHTSIDKITNYLPSYAGLHLEKEITVLSKVLSNAEKPLVVIIGGAKIEDKLPVIEKFLKIADLVLLGGKLSQEWKGPVASNLRLPIDYALEKKDIGPKTIASYLAIISSARTVLWVGPMGQYENPQFILGTKEIAHAILRNSDDNFSVVGGGDTITALSQITHLNRFNFVSTGGSAMLQFLAGGILPGLQALGYHS